MNKHTSWLLAEIDRWTAEQIISPEQATKLRRRYAEPVSAVGLVGLCYCPPPCIRRGRVACEVGAAVVSQGSIVPEGTSPGRVRDCFFVRSV